MGIHLARRYAKNARWTTTLLMGWILFGPKSALSAVLVGFASRVVEVCFQFVNFNERLTLSGHFFSRSILSDWWYRGEKVFGLLSVPSQA